MPDLKIRVSEEFLERLEYAKLRAKVKTTQALVVSLLDDWLATVEGGRVEFPAKSANFGETPLSSGDILTPGSRGDFHPEHSRVATIARKVLLEIQEHLMKAVEDALEDEHSQATGGVGRGRGDGVPDLPDDRGRTEKAHGPVVLGSGKTTHSKGK